MFEADDLSSPEPVRRPAPGPDVDHAARVVAEWGIDARTVEALGSPMSPTSNLLVRAGDGDAFVLKGRDGAGGERLREEAALGVALARAGVPVSVPVTKPGGALAHRDADTSWVLQHYVEGRHFTGGEAQLAAAARGLVALSKAAAADGWHRASPADEPDAPDRLRTMVSSSTFSAWAPSAAVDARDRILGALDESRAADRVIVAPAVVHLDLHPANIVFDGDRLAAILDLEDVAVSPPDAAAGFAAYKLIRRALVGSDGGGGPSMAAVWRDSLLHAGWSLPLAALRAGAVARVLVLITRILDAEAIGDHRYRGDLGKQLRSLEEIPIVFGDCA